MSNVETNVVIKKPALPTVLEETLLVEINDPSVGLDPFGNAKQMTMSRAAYDQQKGDFKMRIVKILKPEGVTMEQHLADLEAAPAIAKAAVQQQAAAHKTGSKLAAPSRSRSKPKPKPAVVVADPVAPAAPSEEEIKAALEAEAMSKLPDLDVVNEDE